jgi:ribosomal protein S18 acetylase RimI-like enzyme
VTEPVIRRLTLEDAEIYRSIRLEALKEAPDAFSSTWEAEIERPFEHFKQRVEAFPIFAAFLNGEVVGMAGCFRESSPKERHKGMLWGMYVSLQARRFRIGAGLVQAVLDHAAGEVEQVRLVVSHGNAAAIGLYERLGFVAYGHEPRALKGLNGYSDDVLMVRFLNGA